MIDKKKSKKIDWELIFYVIVSIIAIIVLIVVVVLKIWVMVEYWDMPITEVPTWALPWLK